MKNVAISRSSRSSEAPTWLGEVYERRRRRTVRLVELSITVLTRAGERVSLAAIARVSKTVDPAEPDGISESAILHNEEAYALYRQHADRKRRAAVRPLSNHHMTPLTIAASALAPIVIVGARVNATCAPVKPNSSSAF